MRHREAAPQNAVKDRASRLRFLDGGGEMGALMRAHDWSCTPLGDPKLWPQSLRTTIRLLLTSRHPMFIWWGPDLIQFYNDAYRKTMGPERHPSALGQRGRECWEEIWDIIGPQIELVMSGRGATWHEDHLVPVTRHGRREDVWWTYGFSPIDDESMPNGVGGVLVVCNDVSEQHRLVDALRTSEERLQHGLQAGMVGTWDWDVQTDCVVADERLAKLYGVAPGDAAAGAPISRFMKNIHPDDRTRLENQIDEAIKTGEEFSTEYRLIQDDQTVRWVLARGHCLYDDTGQPSRFPGAAVDITARKEAEEHRALLMNELHHRVKNTLTTVQAIARQTLCDDVSMDEARTAFDARLMALSKAQDVLIGQQLAGADLADIVNGAVEPFSGDNCCRFQIAGGEVRITPQSSLVLALALHELCTNAAKYGALSTPDGKISLSWRLHVSDGRTRELRIEWVEQGGPEVLRPQRKGFGSKLIETILPMELAGDVRIDYRPDGINCTITAPIATIS